MGSDLGVNHTEKSCNKSIVVLTDKGEKKVEKEWVKKVFDRYKKNVWGKPSCIDDKLLGIARNINKQVLVLRKVLAYGNSKTLKIKTQKSDEIEAVNYFYSNIKDHYWSTGNYDRKNPYRIKISSITEGLKAISDDHNKNIVIGTDAVYIPLEIAFLKNLLTK